MPKRQTIQVTWGDETLYVTEVGIRIYNEILAAHRDDENRCSMAILAEAVTGQAGERYSLEWFENECPSELFSALAEAYAESKKKVQSRRM